MGYPYGDTYLKRIQKSVFEVEDIRSAYRVLKSKYCKEHGTDNFSLPIQQEFALLGEAFELSSSVLDGIADPYHFMWDVLDALLPERHDD